MLEPSLPMWMSDTMHAPEWQQGKIMEEKNASITVMSTSTITKCYTFFLCD